MSSTFNQNGPTNQQHVMLIAVMLLITSHAASFHSQSPSNLNVDYEPEFTSNNSINSSQTQTLLSSINALSSDVTGVIDSNYNSHIFWVNVSFPDEISYAMFNSQGILLIAPTQSNQGMAGYSVSDISVDIDDSDRLHIAWNIDDSSINIMALDPYMSAHNGQADPWSNLAISSPRIIAGSSAGDRSDPDIVIDGFGAIHVVWMDTEDPLGILYNSPQVFYSMLNYDDSSSDYSTIVGNTIVTTSISASGNPAISMGENDTVVIVWQDTYGSAIEYVGLLDTSGSMNSAWADMCTVFYGGTFFSGGANFPGLKPMLLNANITLFETLYAIGGDMPVTTGNCAPAYATGGNGNEGPRTTPLGIIPGDDSGGMRKLNNIMFGGTSLSITSDGGGLGSEAWGPSSTWACMSWRDAQGRLGNLADPPTPTDHRWNPNATRIIIPVSDENAYDGNSQDPNDIQSIEEAHDACVLAEVSPVPLWVSSSASVGGEMRDLAECPTGLVGNPSSARSCPGSTVRNTHAGGMMFSFPASSSSTAEMELMVNEMVSMAANAGSTEIFLTILDPYSFIGAARGTWSMGSPGHTTDGGTYNEYVGPSIGSDGYGNLVIVNDTRLTNEGGWSINPDVAVDESGDIHVTWSDIRSGNTSEKAPNQVNYIRLDPNRVGPYDGAPNGLSLDHTAVVPKTALPASNLTWSGAPRLDVDNDGSIHITWFETEESKTDLRWTQMKSSSNSVVHPLDSNLNAVYSEISTKIIASGSSDLMGIIGEDFVGSQPIVNFDTPFRYFLWLSSNCQTSIVATGANQLCLYGEVDYIVEISRVSEYNSPITLAPNEYIQVNYNVEGINFPSFDDTIQIYTSDAPENWHIGIGFHWDYQTQTSIYQGDIIPVVLTLWSPTIREADSNQSFNIVISLESVNEIPNYVVNQINLEVNLVSLIGWDDDDQDGILDVFDSCEYGEQGWISDLFTDHDSDGCRDSTAEDNDDDNDGVPDYSDNCPRGEIGYVSWIPDLSNDKDGDGCYDGVEDLDLDEDGITNLYDSCPEGEMFWDSNLESLDHDGDGCLDSIEDDNDDNDPYLDIEDSCPSGLVAWDDPNLDYDSDGCTSSEDDDDDNDGISDLFDYCYEGFLSWESDSINDHDSDGCLDSIEDPDTDNDGLKNNEDVCPFSTPNNVISNTYNDWDQDGCFDDVEDNDDDNDGLIDSVDSCPQSELSITLRDIDLDGCFDDVEDEDLDNDGVITIYDNCESPSSQKFISSLENDIDSDGCEDSTEDLDDDNDGVADLEDECLISSFTAPRTDYDGDGCLDVDEDNDDDNDGIIDSDDLCPMGEMDWISDANSDFDSDGCLDATEDEHVEKSIIDIIRADSRYSMGGAALFIVALAFIIGRTTRSKKNSSRIDNLDPELVRQIIMEHYLDPDNPDNGNSDWEEAEQKSSSKPNYVELPKDNEQD